MTLSDGLHLPRGTLISMPAAAVSMDNTLIPNADQFDGFRWLKEGLSSSAFSSTGPTHLHWGVGRYSCPGRWFATVMMKAILVRLMMEYDFRFEEGQQRRPKDFFLEISIVPAPFANVFFKKRVATDNSKVF
jgi:cytochrome P450 monooxygenase